MRTYSQRLSFVRSTAKGRHCEPPSSGGEAIQRNRRSCSGLLRAARATLAMTSLFVAVSTSFVQRLFVHLLVFFGEDYKFDGISR